MDLSKKAVLVLLFLCCAYCAEDHHDHTGHDHTGSPHGLGSDEEECPDDDDHDHDDHDDEDDHDDHGHDDDHDDHGHDDDHDDHGHDDDHDDDMDHDDHKEHDDDGYDGKEGACPNTEHIFDGNEHYLQLMEKSPKLKDITICFYATTSDKGLRGVIVSIHTDRGSKNLVVFGEGKKQLVFRLEGQTRRVTTSFATNAEVHICIVTNSADKSMPVFINGVLLKTVTFHHIRGLRKDGTVQIGRMKEDKNPMYAGKIRNFMMWNKMLTAEQIKKIFNDNHCPGDATIVLLPQYIIPLKANVPTEACPKRVYSFDNTGDKVEYLESADEIPTTKYLTVCVQVTTNAQGIIQGTLASYGTKDQPEMISVGGEIGKDGKPHTRFVVAGQVKDITGQYMPNTNHRFCMVYHLQHNHLMTYINGKFSKKIMFDDVNELPGGGTVTIGQRQRKLGGCFDRSRAYTGKMEDFMIWTRAFSDEDIAAYSAGNCPMDAHTTTDRRRVIPHGKFYTYATCPATDFNLDNQGSVLEYVTVTKSLPMSEYVTVCTKVTTNAMEMIPGIIGSYSTNEDKEALAVGGAMGPDGPELHITLNGDTKEATGKFESNKEYNFCISFHTPHGHGLTFINGKFIRDFFFPNAKAIPSGGKIIVGQYQECPGECFKRSAAYTGRIRNFMVWDRALSAEEMAGIAMTNECPDDHVIDLTPGNAAKVSSTLEAGGTR